VLPTGPCLRLPGARSLTCRAALIVGLLVKPRHTVAGMDTTASSPTNLGRQLARLRAAHQQRAPDYCQRIDDLKRLRAAFKSRLDEFAAAMSADFGRR